MKVALITGASAGLGKEFLRAGVHVPAQDAVRAHFREAPAVVDGDLPLLEEPRQLGLARSLAVEAHGIEADHIKDVAHVELVEVYAQRVSVLCRGQAVDDEVLLFVGYAEVVYKQAVVAVKYVAGFHLPGLAAENEHRRQHTHMGLGLALLVGVEFGDGVERRGL